MLRYVRPVCFVLSLVFLLGVACGGDSDSSATPTANLEIRAQNLKFNQKRLTALANTTVTIRFDNRDSGTPHNVAVYTNRSAQEKVFVGETFSGSDARQYQFQTPAAGDYFFRCDTHPDTMSGTFAVR